MSIEKMQYVNIVGLEDSLDKVLQKCVESGCFHIESAKKTLTESGDCGFRTPEEENPYKELLKRIIDIDLGDKFKYKKCNFDDVKGIPIEKITTIIDNVEKQALNMSSSIREIKNKLFECKQALLQLQHLQGMNIDLETLFDCRHINIRFGKLPCDSYAKLEYYDDKTFEFVWYDKDDQYYWGIYFVPIDYIKEADEIFTSLYFERIWVPDFVTGTPQGEIDSLKKTIDETKNKLDAAVLKRDEFIKENSEQLNKFFCRIKYIYSLFEYRHYDSILKGKFYLVGFIPKNKVDAFKKLFAEFDDVSIVFKAPEEEESFTTPVKLKSNKFSKPFSMFVEMYGLPSYNGFNPMTLVAITYTLLFGIMFGDLGQGLVVALIGFIMNHKKKGAFGQILIRIGFSSAFFGLLFGSVFGFENVLDPIYKSIGLKHKPLEVMENMNFVIACAIGIGVVLILISIIINIITRFKKKQYQEALFGNNGVAGFVLFTSILFGLISTMFLSMNVFKPLYIIFLIILPVLLMFFREPLGCWVSGKKYKMEGGIGDFIACNFFEVFEFMLSYATNTLSFVRVGGFVFSHAGMMSVVMLLAEGAAKGVSPVVIVIGNIFVIGMEGLLSGIQVLRLEFYEIFSRFYDGDGRAFEPISVNYDTVID